MALRLCLPCWNSYEVDMKSIIKSIWDSIAVSTTIGCISTCAWCRKFYCLNSMYRIPSEMDGGCLRIPCNIQKYAIWALRRWPLVYRLVISPSQESRQPLGQKGILSIGWFSYLGWWVEHCLSLGYPLRTTKRILFSPICSMNLDKTPWGTETTMY